MSVDLPEPEAPITATNSPRAIASVTACEGREAGLPQLVDAAQIAHLDQRLRHRRHRRGAGAKGERAGCFVFERTAVGHGDRGARGEVPLHDLGVALVAQPRAQLDAAELRAAVEHEDGRRVGRRAPRGDGGGRRRDGAVALGPEAQRAQRHAQHILAARRGDRHRRGHAGLEGEVAVVDFDDDVVGHHVQHRDRGVAHLHHAALEDAARIRVDAEARRLALAQRRRCRTRSRWRSPASS